MDEDLLKAENERLAIKLEYGVEYYKNKIDVWDNKHLFVDQYETHQEVNELLKKVYDKEFNK